MFRKFLSWTGLVTVLAVGFVIAATVAGGASSDPTSTKPSVTYVADGQTVTGKVWDEDIQQLEVAPSAGGAVSVIARSSTVPPPDTTPTTPTETTTTPTTPDPPATTSRPYSDASPFNQPVGSSPAVLANSASLVATAMPTGKPSNLSTSRNNISGSGAVNYDHPIYYPSATDPMATVKFNSPLAISYRIPVPNYAVPAGASDHHIGFVYDGWEYNLWNATKSGSAGSYTFTAAIGGRMPANGVGIKTPALVQQYGSGYEGGVEAKYGLRAGMIQADEMKAGKINHALFVVVKGAQSGDNGAVYPGYSKTVPQSGYKTNPTSVWMGQRFWLDMSDAAIDATAAPAWEKIIAHAAHQYGIYVGDKGGDGFGFMEESSVPDTTAGLPDRWASYWPAQGVRKDPTYGYGVTFSAAGASAIWSHLKAIAPPSA